MSNRGWLKALSRNISSNRGWLAVLSRNISFTDLRLGVLLKTLAKKMKKAGCTLGGGAYPA
ncbi:hypothetical protein BHU09_10725 [Tannerella sp. oral taxon 808]|nr:hypothetical protein BHU09_10725 [Tannerella sp. oral taxon 808]